MKKNSPLEKSQCDSIAVDVMGADLGAAEIISGVRLAFENYGSLLSDITVVGQEDTVVPLLEEHKLQDKVSFLQAAEVIAMDEKPVQSIKRKKDSSMMKAIDLVKSGEADAILSCGNTGSLMAAGTLKLRPIKGLERPALATVIPTKDHHFVLIDVGANPDSSPKHLLHNAILGSYYANAILEKKNPRVGLLTIGTEEGKGNEAINKSHLYLKELDGKIINYVGLIEGFHVFDNHVDVVVCDGFVGNILLKTCESLFKNLKDYLRQEFCKNLYRKTCGMLAKGVFQDMKKQFDPERHGGAPLLGLNGTVMKAHGSSNRIAIMNAIKVCSQFLKCQNKELLLNQIACTNSLLEKIDE